MSPLSLGKCDEHNGSRTEPVSYGYVGQMSPDASTGTSPDGRDGGPLHTLLADCAAGDRDAFERLYDRTNARIYGLALRVIRDPHYAEEIVQESYLQFWKNASDYHPGRGSAITWMLTITHRRAVDRVRSEELHHRRSDEYGAASAAVPAATPIELIVEGDEANTLRGCLGDLTELQRSSIEMSYFDGLSYPEVAEQTSTPLPTIKSRIRDGLRRLKNCLRSSDDA